jgi:hypothetical protein
VRWPRSRRARREIAFTTTRVGAMFGLFFSKEQVVTYAQAIACDTAAFNFGSLHAMLDRGRLTSRRPAFCKAGLHVEAAHDDAPRSRPRSDAAPRRLPHAVIADDPHRRRWSSSTSVTACSSNTALRGRMAHMGAALDSRPRRHLRGAVRRAGWKRVMTRGPPH